MARVGEPSEKAYWSCSSCQASFVDSHSGPSGARSSDVAFVDGYGKRRLGKYGRGPGPGMTEQQQRLYRHCDE